jgi:uncharacterized protein with ATP-grasp and redox domains
MRTLKVGSRCGYCLLHRGYRMINLSTDNEELRLKAMDELLKFLGEEYSPDAVPSVLGATRGRIIAQVTGCPDPYVEMKKDANNTALELLPELQPLIDQVPDHEKFRKACLISCLGNVIDYDVPGNNSDITAAMDFLDQGFHIDDTDELKALIKPGVKLLFFTDNAGEIVFDKLVVAELRRLGCIVTVAVKGGPGLNDATMEDAEYVSMTETADRVITTGTDAIGVRLDESPEWFHEIYYETDLIIAKGMANFETLSESPAPCPLMYLFRSKCEPVAQVLDVPLHQSIALLVEKGWSLSS